MNRTTFDAGPLAEVAHEASGERWTLVFVRELRHPPEKVWASLTDPAQLHQWAPFTADRDLGRVGEATLTMVDGDQPEDVPASVTRVEPPSLLEYSWGADMLRWELEATASGVGTRLTLRHTIENQADLPKMAAGWHLCLVVAQRLLDGNPIGPIRGDEATDFGWQDLHDAYALKLT